MRVRFTYAYAFKRNSQLFENWNDAAIISMPMFATCQGKIERIILFMRNRESAFVLSAASSERSSVRISHGPEAIDFRC